MTSHGWGGTDIGMTVTRLPRDWQLNVTLKDICSWRRVRIPCETLFVRTKASDADACAAGILLDSRARSLFAFTQSCECVWLSFSRGTTWPFLESLFSVKKLHQTENHVQKEPRE